jgi:hypothetical protein
MPLQRVATVPGTVTELSVATELTTSERSATFSGERMFVTTPAKETRC